MSITPWKTLDSRYVLKDRWMTLRADRCETERGVVVDPYYVQEILDWVHVVAFDDQKRVLVTKQYRHGAGSVSIEIPCGCVEAGEDPGDAMRRELLEETGCSVDTLDPLPAVSPNPARYSNKIFPFIATGTRVISKQNLDESENIEFEFLTISQILELLRSGKMDQALHTGTLFLAFERMGLIEFKG